MSSPPSANNLVTVVHGPSGTRIQDLGATWCEALARSIRTVDHAKLETFPPRILRPALPGSSTTRCWYVLVGAVGVTTGVDDVVIGAVPLLPSGLSDPASDQEIHGTSLSN